MLVDSPPFLVTIKKDIVIIIPTGEGSEIETS